MQLSTVALFCLFGLIAAEDQPVCSVNQLFNGQICTCAPGYFSSANEESKSRCQDECQEVYYSWFTEGKCVSGLFERVGEDQQPACNMRCGMRVRLWAQIATLAVIAAAVATLIFTIPMCIATCSSCLHARRADRHSKKIYTESQSGAGTMSKEQQLAAVSYNPYSYWPYYGRA
uniref:Uncharacterized protein n=1 Tax=Panagrolaimus sp. JU765 TaxID=591449 RepID=A0AC34QZ38_9BILA